MSATLPSLKCASNLGHFPLGDDPPVTFASFYRRSMLPSGCPPYLAIHSMHSMAMLRSSPVPTEKESNVQTSTAQTETSRVLSNRLGLVLGRCYAACLGPVQGMVMAKLPDKAHRGAHGAAPVNTGRLALRLPVPNPSNPEPWRTRLSGWPGTKPLTMSRPDKGTHPASTGVR